MTSGIGQFVKPPTANGDRVQAQTLVGKHLLVWVKELKTNVKTKFNSGPAANAAAGNEGVVVDLYVMDTQQVFIGAMWMAGAIKDGLKQYVGDGNAYPIEIFQQQGGANGWYLDIKPLEGEWLAFAQANLAAVAQLVAGTRVQKEAEWAANAAAPQAPGAVPGIPSLPGMATPAAAPQAPAMMPAAQAPAAPPQQMQAPAAPPQQHQAPQYAPPAAPAQQSQVPVAPPTAPAAGIPQAPPAQQYAPPVAAPAQPGQMTNGSVADLQAKLNQIG